MKDIKSKPKNVRSNTHKLKTSDSARGKATVPMSAVDSLKSNIKICIQKIHTLFKLCY